MNVANLNFRRNPALELDRILLMFGICLLHCVCQGRFMHHWPWNVLGCCVPGFVFISGYFGVRFSFSKVIRLYSVAVYASLIAPLVGGAWWTGVWWQEVVRVWNADGGFWFVHAYVLLLVMSPIVNVVFEKCEKREAVLRILPLLLVVFGWGCLRNYNCLAWLIPTSPGLKAESFLTFMAVYCIGRCVRLLHIDERVPLPVKSVVAISLFVLISCTQGFLKAGNNPLCVCLAVVLFLLIKELKMPFVLSRVILFLAPFMFSVYCISGTIYFPFTEPKFFSIIEWCKDSLADRGMPVMVTLIAAAGLAFVVGIVFALPQWLLAKIFNRQLSVFYSFVDSLPERMVRKLEKL